MLRGVYEQVNASSSNLTGVVERVQPLCDQIQIVQCRNNGKNKHGLQKPFAQNRNPVSLMHLQEHHKHDGCNLGECVGFAENAGTKIAQAGNRIKNSTHNEYADVTAKDDDSELPRNFVND